MPKMPLEPAVVVGAPRGARVADIADRLFAGGAAGQAIEVEAVDEAPRNVGFGELPRDHRGDVAHMRSDRLLDPDVGRDEGMVKEVTADLVRGIGEVVRSQEQAGRADAVGGDDDHVGGLKVPLAGRAIDVNGTGGPAVAAGLDPEDARIDPEIGAG